MIKLTTTISIFMKAQWKSNKELRLDISSTKSNMIRVDMYLKTLFFYIDFYLDCC